MKWNRDKKMIDRRIGLLLCIIKNQIAMMEALEKLLSTYEHTAKYGLDYMNLLRHRIESSEKII